ncbi:cytochrome P450 [Actinomadura welshii]
MAETLRDPVRDDIGAVDLTDARFWIGRDAHATVARMRRAAPVQLHHTPTEGPIWSVLDYATAVEVLGDGAAFGSSEGSLLGTGPEAPAGSGRMMALTDAPRHREYRDRAAPFFSTRAVRRLEDRVRGLCVELIDRAVGRGTVDFVTEIASVIPMTVMCEVMDVPAADRPEVVRLCDEAFLSGSPDRRRSAHQGLFAYLMDLALRRRSRPGDDLVSALAADTGDRPPLTVEEVILNCDNIIVGGVQTVRHTAAMSLHTLMRHPDAWERLSSGAADVDRAVEELLRWTSVGVHVLRTARRDTELAGRRIAEGDRVVVWVPAANRDDRMFERPDELDLDRSPNRHLAFGRGPHFCIGAMLARLELRLLLEELVRRVEAVEEAGAAVPALSIINLGLAAQPVRLTPRRSA